MNPGRRRTTGWLAFGLLLSGFVLWFLVGAYPPEPLSGGGFAPGMVVVVPASIGGGLAVAHGVSRSLSGKRDASGRLLAYPLVTGLVVSIPAGYLAFSPNYGSFPTEWVALGVFTALFPAAALKGSARSR